MYCPRCGAENKPEQNFCRQCGLSLPFVRLALEGRVEQALTHIKQGYESVGGSVGTLWIFIVIGLLNWFFHATGSGAINLLIGLLITVPWVYRGFRRLQQALRLLDSDTPAPSSAMADVEPLPLPPVPDTDPLRVNEVQPPSVIEPTTRELLPRR